MIHFDFINSDLVFVYQSLYPYIKTKNEGVNGCMTSKYVLALVFLMLMHFIMILTNGFIHYEH